ncbi:MAG TPA: peroxide stress protein YaaA [Myxococcales bacterium]|nr:peroxide stress protein YaaA [Myxococcales bacterium]HAN32516.1 peroxide stress protein YaaA [Myxococcales bacterium]
MLTLLSPAKKLDFSPAPAQLQWSEPALWDDAQPLLKCLRSTSVDDLKSLMKISDSLATLNYQRHVALSDALTVNNSKQAALTFAGDVCWGLDPTTLQSGDWNWAQDKMVFLSGLFGVLRPLDGIQAYRLEMGTRIKNPRGANLYEYWGPTVTDRLNEMTSQHNERTIINLASQEYSKVVRRSSLNSQMITIGFKEIRPQGPKTIGVVAKRSRGKFARWLIKNRVEKLQELKQFDIDDYRFDSTLSSEDNWIFSRVDVPGRMQQEFQARKNRDQVTISASH